jgi:hypothetical protein
MIQSGRRVARTFAGSVVSLTAANVQRNHEVGATNSYADHEFEHVMQYNLAKNIKDVGDMEAFKEAQRAKWIASHGIVLNLEGHLRNFNPFKFLGD